MTETAPSDLVGGLVDGDCSIRIEIDGKIVRFPVDGFGVEAEIGDRTRENMELVKQSRCQEGQSEADPGLFKGIDRTGRQHTDRGLIHFRRTGDVAQKTEGFPVNAEESGDGLSRSCPVTGEGIGKTIGSRPDRKIRIVHYKRIRRITNRFTCHGKKLLLLVE